MYIYIYIYKHIYIHICNTNGAAAKVMRFDRLGKKGTPWHSWEDYSRLKEIPKKVPLSKKLKFAVIPLVLTPFVPFRGPLVELQSGLQHALAHVLSEGSEGLNQHRVRNYYY